jgi:hypothetical protein
MYTSGMPRSYTVASARAKLAEMIDEVEVGKEVELTRRGNGRRGDVSGEVCPSARRPGGIQDGVRDVP